MRCRCARLRGPVATTGTSRCLSARATLIPLPPASVRLWLARCRWPSWKFGTVSVRSSAALSVTVTIIENQPPMCVNGAAGVEAERGRRGPDATPTAPATSGSPRDEAASRRARAPRRARWPFATGSDSADGATTRSTSGLSTRTAANEPLRRTSAHAALAVAELGVHIDPVRLHEPHRPVARRGPSEQRREVGVALRPRRAAEDRRVERDAVPAHGRDLAPARAAGVPGLHADQAGERRRAGRSRCAACGRPRSSSVRWRTIERTRGARIAICASSVTSCARRDVARRVEPVGPREVRAVEAELAWPSRSSSRRTRSCRRARRSPPSASAASFALWISAPLSEIADGDALARAQVDASTRRPRAASARDAHDVVELRSARARRSPSSAS